MCRICRARGIRRRGDLAVVTRADVRPPPPPPPVPRGPEGAPTRAELSGGGAEEDDGDDEGLCLCAPLPDAAADDDDPDEDAWHRVVVGAGVAGVCCAEELARLRPSDRVTLVAADDALKAVTNVERVTRNLETFDVQNRPHSALAYPNLAVVRGVVEACDPGASTLVVRPFDSTAANTTETIAYDQLCVCVGAEPRRALDPCDRSADPHGVYDEAAVAVRDTESVEDLRERLGEGARTVVLVGNGGIAMELVQALCWDEEPNVVAAAAAAADDDDDDAPTLVWLCRHPTIGDAFFDRDAAEFLADAVRSRTTAAGAPSGAPSGVPSGVPTGAAAARRT